MSSPFKNATKEEIYNKLKELKEEEFPFHMPALDGDTFWIYCNARRYWGTYKDALKEAGVKLDNDIIKSENGYEIDHWRFVNKQNRKDWFLKSLLCLNSKCINISSHSLKNSPYFDIYTDAVNLFGKYNTALEAVNVSKNREGAKFPESKEVFEDVLEMYTCESQERKCEILKKFNLEYSSIGDVGQITSDCIVLVDGSNVAYRNNKASLENIILIDKYLQEIGFRKENISIIFDANFPHKCNIDRDDFAEFMHNDPRYCMAPARQKADVFILTKAHQLFKKNPNYPPLIITNDKYEEHFEGHPELDNLKSCKKGVVWTYIQKRPQPVINVWLD